MSAGRYNFVADQGATFAKTVTWKDGEGDPVNLTGFTARMHIRESYAASDTAVTPLTTENGGITLGGAAGTIALLIPASAMALLDIPDVPGTPPKKNYVYDLELISAGGVVTKLLHGLFIVRREVTR